MRAFARQFLPAAAMVLAATSAHAENSFPQLDTTSFPNQLFWLAVTFVALFLVVSKTIAPSVSEVLSARKATIADAIAKAEAYKQHAEKARSELQAGGQSSRAKAAELMGKAQAEIAKKHADAMAALNADLDKQAAKASAALAKSVNHASAELETASAELAQAMVGKLLGSNVAAKNGKAA